MVDEFLLFASAGNGLSGAVSAAALALSGFAAWRANQQTVQLQRQSDALLGDLPPNFFLHRVAGGVHGERSVDTFLLLIENHNRRTIGIRALSVVRPKRTGLVAYQVNGPNEELIGRMERKHDEVEASILVPGTRPGAPSVSAARLKLVLVGLDGMAVKPATQVCVKVDYEVLSAVPEPRTELVNIVSRSRR
jgi:hypothetical protein